MTTAIQGEQVWAKVPMIYAGDQLDRGQLIQLGGHPKDAQLVGLRYFIPYRLETDTKVFSCDTCGRKFIQEQYYTMHKRKETCNARGKEITRNETAELLDVEADKLRMDE